MDNQLSVDWDCTTGVFNRVTIFLHQHYIDAADFRLLVHPTPTTRELAPPHPAFQACIGNGHKLHPSIRS